MRTKIGASAIIPDCWRPLPRSSVSKVIFASLRPIKIGCGERSAWTNVRSSTLGWTVNAGLLTSWPSLFPTLAATLYVVSIAVCSTALRVRRTVIVQFLLLEFPMLPISRRSDQRAAWSEPSIVFNAFRPRRWSRCCSSVPASQVSTAVSSSVIAPEPPPTPVAVVEARAAMRGADRAAESVRAERRDVLEGRGQLRGVEAQAGEGVVDGRHRGERGRLRRPRWRRSNRRPPSATTLMAASGRAAVPPVLSVITYPGGLPQSKTRAL